MFKIQASKNPPARFYNLLPLPSVLNQPIHGLGLLSNLSIRASSGCHFLE